MSRVSRAQKSLHVGMLFPKFSEACRVWSCFVYVCVLRVRSRVDNQQHGEAPHSTLSACLLSSEQKTLSWDSTSEKFACDVYLSNKKFLRSHSFSSKGLPLALSRVPPGVRHRGPPGVRHRVSPGVRTHVFVFAVPSPRCSPHWAPPRACGSQAVVRSPEQEI